MIKTAITIALGLGSVPVHAESCNQRMYDAIYEFLSRETIIELKAAKTPEQTRAATMHRADTLESLRKLCNGQRSKYDKGVKNE